MGLMEVRKGTAADFAVQWAKRAAFRWPILRDISRPRYAYDIYPAQLAWLCDAIGATKGSEGCVAEVGCARGMTTTFLLKHMKEIGDSRTYVCLDTFCGFLDKDISFEVTSRKKRARDYRGYRYNDAGIFHRNMEKCGYPNHKTIQADASTFDWNTVPQIDVMLLDVDLYLPTKTVLENSISHWSARARIMVDDVERDPAYDGAGVAYSEFCKARGLPFVAVGKGAVLQAPLAPAATP